MLKKFFIATVLTLALISSSCLAMKLSEFSLGGMSLNMTYDEVIKIYGQPTQILNGYSQLVSKVVTYGDNVEIGFLGNKVRYVVTKANNGWKTPAGVRVGMTLAEVLEIYGGGYTAQTRAPEDIPKWMRESCEPYFEYNWSGTKYSWAQVADAYAYEPGDVSFVLSVVVNNDRVSAIELSQRTPEY